MTRNRSKGHGDKVVWHRLLHIAIFAVIFNIVEVVLVALVAFQWLSTLITGQANERLKGLGAELAGYVAEIVRFLTYGTDDRPYPFGPWPAAKSGPANDATPRTA